MRRALENRHADRVLGFTLVELLIALSLVGLIAVLAGSGLRAGAATWKAGRSQASTSDEIGSAQRFLRRQVSQAYPMRAADSGSEPGIIFRGKWDRVQFVGHAPRQFSGNALYAYKISSRRASGGKDLVLSWCAIPLCDAETRKRREYTDSVLVERIGRAVFEYGYLDRAGDLHWDRNWQDQPTLPALLRLSIQFARGDTRSWPPLTIALSVTRDSHCAFDPVSRDCRES